EITLNAGQVYQGIVGRVTVEAEGMRFTAGGKEDLSGLKSAVDKAALETQALLEKFAADSENRFLALAKEKDEVKRALEEKRSAVRLQRGSSTLADLKIHLQSLAAARTDNKVTLRDKEACAGKHLSPAVEIDRWCVQKDGEIQQARDNLATLEEKRPVAAEKDLHRKTLEAIRKKARESAAAFSDADEMHREPRRELQDELRKILEKKRAEQSRLAQTRVDAEKRVSDLGGQLKQAQPHRPLDSIHAELEEARESHNREQILQEARALLKERIEDKMRHLAAHVPVELGEKVTQHLSRLTGGSAVRGGLRRDTGSALWGEVSDV